MNNTAFIGPERIMNDWNVSKSTAYNIIKRLNKQLKNEHPSALIISGKVNKIWYDEVCLRRNEDEQDNYKRKGGTEDVGESGWI